MISIHALRVEGDKSPWALRTVFGISIHALRVEGDDTAEKCRRDKAIFLSTPSEWRATFVSALEPPQVGISIHALRVEGDRAVRVPCDELPISIHALRVEGDHVGVPAVYTRSVISIHALRVEGDFL